MLSAVSNWLENTLKTLDVEKRLKCHVITRKEGEEGLVYTAACHDDKTGRNFLLDMTVELVGEPDLDYNYQYTAELISIKAREGARGKKL